MPISDIVNVIITRQTATISEQGFGIPLILGTNVAFEQRVKYYTNMDEVALDFDPNSSEYIAAQDIFSQTISPSIIAIGRRAVDELTINVITALNNSEYNVNVNGIITTVSSTPTATFSQVVFDSDFVPGNRINIVVNGDQVGSSTAIIDFSADFGAGQVITPTINGTPLAGVNYAGNQADTMTALAAALQVDAAVDTATVTGLRQITLVFEAGNNILTSIITPAGPTASISQGAFEWMGTQQTTMDSITDVLNLIPEVSQSFVSGVDFRTLSVVGQPNVSLVVDSVTTTGGLSQPNSSISQIIQPVTKEAVAASIVAAINNEFIIDPTYPVEAFDNGDGTIRIESRDPGVPFSLRLSTNIGSPNQANVNITQISPSQVYTVTLNGVPFTYQSPPNIQDSSTILMALATSINSLPQMVDVSADVQGETLVIASNNPANVFSIQVSDGIMSVEKGLNFLPFVNSATVVEDLDAINAENSDWYALISTSREPSTVLAIADWVEARIKLFGTASSDPLIINSPAGTDQTSIAAVLNQGGYVRTFVMYHQDADFDYPEAAWFGRVLPLEPGSETWKFKALNSVSYSNLTSNQSRTALAKSANTYEFVGGVGITANGTVAQGEFIDIIRGVDWLRARIQEFVYRTLVENEKVPYTDAGIASIQAQVMRVLQIGIDNQFIAETPVPRVTVPRAIDVPPADKANRILRNVRFTATLAGAIHSVEIRGNLSV